MFTVKIHKTDNVSILKELIKEKNTNSFGKFDSKQLDQWIDNLDTNLSLKLENATKISPPTRKLSEFFDEAVDEGLHIIVKRLSVYLTFSRYFNSDVFRIFLSQLFGIWR
jgi:crinkler effector protein